MDIFIFGFVCYKACHLLSSHTLLFSKFSENFHSLVTLIIPTLSPLLWIPTFPYNMGISPTPTSGPGQGHLHLGMNFKSIMINKKPDSILCASDQVITDLTVLIELSAACLVIKLSKYNL